MNVASRLTPLALVALAQAACVHGPSVSVSRSALPLQRVVVYRNGVGYFERHGRVHNDHVEFRVRQSEVGDFLATLAVMEQGGSSVRSAAFPMPDARSRPGDDDRRSVRLALDGREHELAVGYMIETPIWRPSYRLVVGPHGAQVQSWGIVQNLSGEDWSNVRLSLVAGAPVSFRSELAEAMVSPRPLVTDRGEVIDAVPHGETALDQAGPAGTGEAPTTTAPAPSTPVGATEPSAEQFDAMNHEPYSGAATRSRPATHHAAASTLAPVATPAAVAANAPPPPPMANPSAPRSVASLAAVAVQGGATRYDLPSAVTIPDHTATMVMLAVRNVPGESVYLFAPDGAVPDSAAHPFHVARFENRTGAMLERGPIAIFEDGSFLGEGMLDPLPDGATATVPFALERGLAVDTSNTDAVEGSRLLRIAHNQITIERFHVQRTTWQARNGMDHAVRIVMRAALAPEAQVFEPPSGTEQSNGAALVPVQILARSHADVVLQTRQPFAVSTDWSDEEAANAIEGYLRDGHPNAELATTLRTALDLRRQLTDLSHDRASLDERLNDLRQNADETRMNLLTIERNRAAADLRAQLTSRLAQLATQIDQLTRRIVEFDTQIGERRVRLAESVRSVQLDLTTHAPSSVHTPSPG